MAFQFHQQTFDLIGITPLVSAESLAALLRTEKDLGFTFPPSVKAWYSIENAISILQVHSNSDHMIGLIELGYDNQPPNVKENLWSEKLLWFMTENQGVCYWAVKLDGSDDPQVMVWVDGRNKWETHANKFSTFVWCQVFDWRRIFNMGRTENIYGLASQAEPLANDDLSYLNDLFEVGPLTYVWPGEQNHRFYRGDQRIVIWAGRDQADWTLSANNPEQLYDLAKVVWNCGNLKTSLYAINPISENVLERLRG